MPNWMVSLLVIDVIIFVFWIREGEYFVAPFVFSLMIDLVLVSVLLFATMIFNGYQETYINREIETNIVSIKSDSGISGSFFLGCGNIGSDVYYYMYLDKGNNKYNLFKLQAENSTIIESDEKPHIIKYRKIAKPNKFNKYTEFMNEERKGTQFYEIVVPRGTIVTNFKLD